MGSLGFFWVCLGFLEFNLVHLGSFWFTLDPFGSHGFTYFYLALLGLFLGLPKLICVDMSCSGRHGIKWLTLEALEHTFQYLGTISIHLEFLWDVTTCKSVLLYG